MNNKQASPKRGCVIWMHGLGADGRDMAGLAQERAISQLALEHVFLDAPVRPVTLNAGMRMRAWYDIVGLKSTDREDKAGILQSQTFVESVIEQQIASGFRSEEIVLAGFSQGGAMALFTALHYNKALAGVVSLSSYLPMAAECKPKLSKETPIFIGFGKFDTLVYPEFTKITEQWLLSTGFNKLTVREYPMEHSICSEEINDMANWLSIHLRGVVPA